MHHGSQHTTGVKVSVHIWRHLCTWLLRKALSRRQDYERSMAMLTVDNDQDDDEQQGDGQQLLHME